jgi:hypothetical protein
LVVATRAKRKARKRTVREVTGDAKGTFNITIGVDPHSWFRTTEGALIDPRALTTEAGLRDLVSGNVRASFHAFSDNQRHGG